MKYFLSPTGDVFYFKFLHQFILQFKTMAAAANVKDTSSPGLNVLADETIKNMQSTHWTPGPAGYSHGRTRHQGIYQIPKLSTNVFYCGNLCGRRFTHAPAAVIHTRKCQHKDVVKDARTIIAVMQTLNQTQKQKVSNNTFFSPATTNASTPEKKAPLAPITNK